MPPRRLRLDAELVRRGLARSREHAGELIAAGRVTVGGAPATKPATGGHHRRGARGAADDPDGPDYVSRGGHKLAGALDAFEPRGPRVAGRRCLDAGASTGGFTDVLLRRGAREVVAVDVGYGQLAWPLRQDDAGHRPRPHERPRPDPGLVGEPVDLVVGDLSFISLDARARRRCSAVTAADGDLVLMVKPQFEVGRTGSARAASCATRRCGARRSRRRRRGRRARAGAPAVSPPSPLPGPSGNVEFFLWLRRGAGRRSTGRAIDAVVSAGPVGGAG